MIDMNETKLPPVEQSYLLWQLCQVVAACRLLWVCTPAAKAAPDMRPHESHGAIWALAVPASSRILSTSCRPHPPLHCGVEHENSPPAEQG